MLKRTAICLASLILLHSPESIAQSAPQSLQIPALDAAARTQVIDVLLRELNAYYVFPDVAKEAERALRAKQQRGGYDQFASAAELAAALTADLDAVAHDKHLRVRASDQPLPPMPAPGGVPSPADEARFQARAKELNYGIGKIETLPGNIGYLELRGFGAVKYVDQAFAAAMNQLADCAALIFDMRGNGGGDPASVAFLTSYLFDKRTHLNDLYWREGDRTEEFWTREDVPGKKFGQQKAVYVLTGPRTFSGAEEFSYNLQQLRRATLIGETTGGGANPGRTRQLTPYMHVFVPNGKAINPITKTNWEHTGVVPDVKVPAAEALATAQKMALEKLAAASETVQPRTGAPVERQVIKVPTAVLDTYLGRYQLSSNMFVDVSRDGDRLFGQATGQPAMELFAMTDTLFIAREVNAEVSFDKDADGVPQLLVNHDGHRMAGKKIK